MISLQYYKRSDNQIIKIKVKLTYFRLSGLFPGYKKKRKKIHNYLFFGYNFTENI